MGRSIRWGILGAGDVCEVKSGPAFQKADRSELVAVMRRDAERAADFARRHGVGKWYDSTAALLADPDIDAVYIATPPRFHLEHCLAALAAGKHVYLEKPMAMDAVQSKAIIAAEAKSPGKVVVAHYRRALPAFKKVGELISDGSIGAVRLAEVNFYLAQNNSMVQDSAANWRQNPEISGGGLFHDLSPHLLDLLLVYFGRPLSFDGFACRQNPAALSDDLVLGTIVFADNVVFRGCWCIGVAPCADREQLVITGDRGTVSATFFGDRVHLCTEAGERVFEFDNPPNIQQPMIEEVNRFFLGLRDCPCSTADGLQVMEIIDRFTT